MSEWDGKRSREGSRTSWSWAERKARTTTVLAQVYAPLPPPLPARAARPSVVSRLGGPLLQPVVTRP